MNSILSFAAALLCATLVPAQTTFTVDDDGGPGVIKDIQDAVDLARSGDIIVVRPGSYSGIRIQNKALSILAEPGAEVNRGRLQSLVAYPLEPDRVTTIRGLRFNASIPSQLISIGHQGTLILDQIEMAGQCTLCDFTSIRTLVVERCKLQGLVMLQGSTNGHITDTEIRGVTKPVSTRMAQNPAVWASGAGQSLQITNSTIVGADAASSQDQPGVAILAYAMRLEIRGDRTSRIEAGRGTLAQSAIQSTSTRSELVYDPRLQVRANGSAPAIRWIGTQSQRIGTVLTSSPAVLGSTLTLNLQAPVGHMHVLLAGLPTVPAAVGNLGYLAVSNPTPIVAGGAGTMQHQFIVPTSPAIRGALVGWQTLGISLGGTPKFGNLSVSTVH